MNSLPALCGAASEKIAVCILQDARYGYLRWGADWQSFGN